MERDELFFRFVALVVLSRSQKARIGSNAEGQVTKINNWSLWGCHAIEILDLCVNCRQVKPFNEKSPIKLERQNFLHLP
jgi:hypothetical protein